MNFAVTISKTIKNLETVHETRARDAKNSDGQAQSPPVGERKRYSYITLFSNMCTMYIITTACACIGYQHDGKSYRMGEKLVYGGGA